MARFGGKVGFGSAVENPPNSGIWKDVIIARTYYGDVVRNSVRFQENGKVNTDLTLGNSISIVADAYANEHFFAVRYVEWAGVLWTVTEVTVESPRLLLRLGGVYNGPTG